MSEKKRLFLVISVIAALLLVIYQIIFNDAWRSAGRTLLKNLF